MKNIAFADLRQHPLCAPYAEEMLAIINNALNNFVVGKIEMSGGARAHLDPEQNSRAEGPYESHERFVDVQCSLLSPEEIELCPVQQLTVTEEYDATRDIAFYDGVTPCTDKVILTPGTCCVIEPGMGHKPCMDHEGRHLLRKIVFKLPVK